MKIFYVLTWLMFLSVVLVTALNRSFDSTALLVISLVAAALISASAMRSVWLQLRNVKSR